MTATCFIVPSSLKTTRSASATVTDEADVPPSIILSSAVVIFEPSNIYNSVSLSAALPKVIDPALTVPVVVNVEDPMSIAPKPDVIEPEFRAPTVVAAVVTRLGIAVISSSK